VRFHLAVRLGVDIYYGLDRHLGFFAECTEAGKKPTYFDAITPGCGYDSTTAPLEAVISWVAQQMGLSHEHVQEVLIARQDGGRLPERLKPLAQVVENLLYAADGG
jgi:hypothetical protein